MKRRAVITGIGVVSPIGTGKDEFWNSLIGGVSGIRPITRFDALSMPVRVAGEVPNFRPGDYMGAHELRRIPLFGQFAIAAARLAVEDARMTITSGNRIGACFASSIGGFPELATEDIPAFNQRGPVGMNPFRSTTFSTHSGTSVVCQLLGLSGPKASIASGCTSGLDVAEWARDQIISGKADSAVVGASDAPLTPFVFGLIVASRAYSSTTPTPRPFDRRHNGAAVSEGGCALVIEELQCALNRNATIYAEIVSHASAGDTGDFFKPPEGECGGRALKIAMRRAELSIEDIDCICPLAPGVPPLDTADARAVKAVMGERAYHIPVPALQSIIGHMIAASSVVQIAAMALALYHQRVPPTINFEDPAPECDLDCVPGRSRASRLRNVLIMARSLNRTCAAMTLTKAPAALLNGQ